MKTPETFTRREFEIAYCMGLFGMENCTVDKIAEGVNSERWAKVQAEIKKLSVAEPVSPSEEEQRQDGLSALTLLKQIRDMWDETGDYEYILGWIDDKIKRLESIAEPPLKEEQEKIAEDLARRIIETFQQEYKKVVTDWEIRSSNWLRNCRKNLF